MKTQREWGNMWFSKTVCNRTTRLFHAYELQLCLIMGISMTQKNPLNIKTI